MEVENLIVAAGMWLLNNKEKNLEDMDIEFILTLNLSLQAEVAKIQGELH
tara:strand:+ start:308 stop:457 length:150 start_codon:yes stop_codon:yes gene_type:complete